MTPGMRRFLEERCRAMHRTYHAAYRAANAVGQDVELSDRIFDFMVERSAITLANHSISKRLGLHQRSETHANLAQDLRL